ncbi:hypothetical protein O6H91_11G120100 [Diphasiastrum complanatum]|uniref:Uncharacterized protein n=1 Tax=Diphasiastrum complanatum TaxID=34168 RepID=A0ACC2CDJ3_DIPCM|nr:hypothetical protein O6H91_11G120100 [Diphasiastrum complanatum]
MLEMLTEQDDVVIDLFAGTGNFPRAAATMSRHCICVENGEAIYTTFLEVLEDNTPIDSNLVQGRRSHIRKIGQI